MKIFMTGGSGFIGITLTGRLTAEGHQVTILTRSSRDEGSLPPGASFLKGNPVEKGNWQDRVAEHDVIINLAGSSIFTRWTDSAKKEMRGSRIHTTANLVESLAGSSNRPFLISTSAVGYYGYPGEKEVDESGPPRNDFLAKLALDWETEALKAERHGARVVITRFGVVLGAEGGALGQMIPLFNKYLGSPLGSGKQWLSWIHEQDLVNIFLFIIERADLSGPVNCTSPHPVRNEELTRVLAELLGKPVLLPAVPGFVLKMMMGEFGDVLLKGQKVVPARLRDLGFDFQFPDLRSALADLLR